MAISDRNKKARKSRQDHRTLKETKAAIKKGCIRENYWLPIMANEIKRRLKKKIVLVEDYAFGSNGEWITDARKLSSDPDKKFLIDGKEHLIEIKTHYHDTDFMTFKRSTIRACVRKEAWIAIVNDRYLRLINPEGVKDVLDNVPVEKVWAFGNKECHRIYADYINEMIKKSLLFEYSWLPSSRKMIKQHTKELFK